MKGPVSVNIKAGLVVIAVLIIIGTLWYTQSIVEKLQRREREIADLYAKSLQLIANEQNAGSEFGFIFQEVIQENTVKIDLPLILSDGSNRVVISYKNISIDSSWDENRRREYVAGLIPEMDRDHAPIEVSHDSTLINYVHYGESLTVTQLRWLPYIEILIAGLFVFIGYIGFSYIKRSEQSNIWVGMARETAHQLGTPLSSLMGWIEILKSNADSDGKSTGTIREFENDVNRLNKIASRFSKIGSKPDLKEENLNDVIHKVITYFERRLPQMGKKVEITVSAPEQYRAMINCELFEWVIENLVKNALDAIEGQGKVAFSLSKKGDFTFIDVSDTGKGIEMKYKKDIFRPGFSTKKRGWGLGLSLSKRIIENYHKGKLFVKETGLGKGTTFRIKLIR
jgi:K+-sensing histidine kinase KdpD